MKKRLRKFISGVGAAIMAATLAFGSLPAYAAQSGTLTIQAPDGYNGTFNVYKVADYAPETSTLTVVDPFKSYEKAGDLTTDNLSTDEAIRKYGEALGAYCGSLQNPAAVEGGSGVSAGKAIHLDYGLYLVMQAQAGDGYYDILPFITFLPSQTGAAPNGVDASIDVEPKLEKRPETPSTPPETPPGDTPSDNPPGTPSNETPVTPVEPEFHQISESGNDGIYSEGGSAGDAEDIGSFTEFGGLTGDSSQIVLYGAVTAVAAAALIVWAVRRRRRGTR